MANGECKFILTHSKCSIKLVKMILSRRKRMKHSLLSLNFLHCSLLSSSLSSPYFSPVLSVSSNHGDAPSQQPSSQPALLVHLNFVPFTDAGC